MTKFLIVDDNEQNLYMLQVLLEGNGYEVVSAKDGSEALEKARHSPPDMIISDILMPVMDGFQLCRHVKGDENLCGIPFVLYTATYTDEKDEQFAMKLGADRFIRKPMEPDELMSTIRGVLKDVEKGRARPKQPAWEDETDCFRLYSQRLVEKLEHKTLTLEGEITKREQVEEALQERVKELTCLHEVNRSMQERLSPEELCRRIIQGLVPAMQFPDITVVLIELDDRRYTSERFPEGLSHGLHADIRAGEKVLGHLSVYYTEDKPFLLPEEQDLVTTIGKDFGLWLTRKQGEEKLEHLLDGTIQALGQTSETRDPYTAGHQRRVTQLACAMAEEMGLSKDQIEGIHVAGLMHDIGKIAIPAEILTKPAKLTKLEFGLITTHPQVSYDILKGIEFPWPVADIVVQHHERLDGSGYPNGLKGDEILLEARILAVADVVEAMASHRPYRAALGVDKALAEIEDKRGRLYASEVVDACLKLFHEEGFEFEE
jgi:putative nucleotidyltransferase with HDIG domain